MKKFILRSLRHCGAFALTRMLTRDMPRILMYHNFSHNGRDDRYAATPDVIGTQFLHLKQHFRVVPLQQLVEQLSNGARLDDGMVVITIDDGRRNCYEVLFPLLREFGFPATFYVVSSVINGDDWIWTDKLLWLSEQPNRPDELSPSGLGALFKTLNRMRPAERDARIENLARIAGCVIPTSPPQKYESCSWDQLREMADSGLVEIGSHSVTHPIFSSLTDEESWSEFTLSRDRIEQKIGRRVRSFCFPNGESGDYRRSQVEQAKRAGYGSAVVSRFGLVQFGADPYELPRIGISGLTDVVTFRKYLDGAEHWQIQLTGVAHPRST